MRVLLLSAVLLLVIVATLPAPTHQRKVLQWSSSSSASSSTNPAPSTYNYSIDVSAVIIPIKLLYNYNNNYYSNGQGIGVTQLYDSSGRVWDYVGVNIDLQSVRFKSQARSLTQKSRDKLAFDQAQLRLQQDILLNEQGMADARQKQDLARVGQLYLERESLNQQLAQPFNGTNCEQVTTNDVMDLPFGTYNIEEIGTIQIIAAPKKKLVNFPTSTMQDFVPLYNYYYYNC